jgi:hypothetical protein
MPGKLTLVVYFDDPREHKISTSRYELEPSDVQAQITSALLHGPVIRDPETGTVWHISPHRVRAVEIVPSSE